MALWWRHLALITHRVEVISNAKFQACSEEKGRAEKNLVYSWPITMWQVVYIKNKSLKKRH